MATASDQLVLEAVEATKTIATAMHRRISDDNVNKSIPLFAQADPKALRIYVDTLKAGISEWHLGDNAYWQTHPALSPDLVVGQSLQLLENAKLAVNPNNKDFDPNELALQNASSQLITGKPSQFTAQTPLHPVNTAIDSVPGARPVVSTLDTLFAGSEQSTKDISKRLGVSSLTVDVAALPLSALAFAGMTAVGGEGVEGAAILERLRRIVTVIREGGTAEELATHADALASHVDQLGTHLGEVTAQKDAAVAEKTAAVQQKKEAQDQLRTTQAQLDREAEARRAAVADKTAQQTRAENAEAEREVQRTRANTTEGKYNTLQGEHSTLQKNYKKLDDEHTTLEGEHSTLQRNNRKLQGDHSTLQKDYKKLDDEHTTLEGEHSTLQRNNRKLQGDHSTLQKDYKKLDDEHTTLEGERDTLQKNIKKLQGEHATLEADHTTLQGNHTALEGERDVWKNRANTEHARANGLQAQLDKLTKPTGTNWGSRFYNWLVKGTKPTGTSWWATEAYDQLNNYRAGRIFLLTPFNAARSYLHASTLGLSAEIVGAPASTGLLGRLANFFARWTGRVNLGYGVGHVVNDVAHRTFNAAGMPNADQVRENIDQGVNSLADTATTSIHDNLFGHSPLANGSAKALDWLATRDAAVYDVGAAAVKGTFDFVSNFFTSNGHHSSGSSPRGTGGFHSEATPTTPQPVLASADPAAPQSAQASADPGTPKPVTGRRSYGPIKDTSIQTAVADKAKLPNVSIGSPTNFG